MAIRKASLTLAALTLAALSTAQLNSKPFGLMVGDAPPKLSVSKWLKGNPVNEFEKGKVYVVEFWATWCGPCKTSIPHLTDLQKKVGDKAQIIGVSVWESEQTLPTVESFVAEWGPKMDYTIAMDQLPEGAKEGRNGSMAKDWMAASGAPGIPTAFIIDREGRVAWIGHPMGMDKPLDDIIAGTWDTNAFAVKYAEGKQKDAKIKALQGKIGEHVKAEKWDDALAAADAYAAAIGQPQAATSMKYNILFMNKKDYDAAYALARTGLASGKLDPFTLNSIAWSIVDPKGTPAKRDLDLALEAATKAVEGTERKDWAVLDTLARVYFMKGDKAKAIEIQKEAISKAPDAASKKDAEASLKDFGG